MSKFNISIKNALIAMAELSLPRFSGQKKILEVMLRMNYEKGTFQHVKVVFWHPGNSMLVAYDFDTHAGDIGNECTVTANHDSTWKYDGLDFFSKIVKEPQDIEIIHSKVKEVKEAGLYENGDFYYFS